MRGIEDIIKDNRAAEAAGHDVGGIGTEKDAADFPEQGGTPVFEPWQERKLNVLQLTIVHDVGRGQMTFTATTPYIEEPNDPVIVGLRNLLAKRFEELTRPGAEGAVWGETTQFPGDAADAPEIRTPSEKKIQLVQP